MKGEEQMSVMKEILAHNEMFTAEKRYEVFTTTKFPNKKLVILTCMDTRLLELLPQALGLKNGDVKLIKNAGAIVSHPFDSVMRSILVAFYELNAEEICVIGHHECGMGSLQAEGFLEKTKQQGIPNEQINTLLNAGIDLKTWLTGFDCVKESVQSSVEVIQSHPLLPNDVPVHGMVIHPKTGKLDVIVNGYGNVDESQRVEGMRY